MGRAFLTSMEPSAQRNLSALVIATAAIAGCRASHTPPDAVDIGLGLRGQGLPVVAVQRPRFGSDPSDRPPSVLFSASDWQTPTPVSEATFRDSRVKANRRKGIDLTEGGEIEVF
jgi:hypothetical protein